MAVTGKEPVFSMGDDTPLPSLAAKPQLLFRYFKQKFSQVTNPPIDPIRERMVMSLRMYLGPKGELPRTSACIRAAACHRLTHTEQGPTPGDRVAKDLRGKADPPDLS